MGINLALTGQFFYTRPVGLDLEQFKLFLGSHPAHLFYFTLVTFCYLARGPLEYFGHPHQFTLYMTKYSIHDNF